MSSKEPTTADATTPDEPQAELPVVDEERIKVIFDDLTSMEMVLDHNPLEYGPRRLGKKIAEVREMATRCERHFMQVSRDLRMYNRKHKAAQLDFDLQTQDLLANDAEVRSGRNVRDRDALATMKLRDERKAIIEMELSIQDLEAVMKVIKAKRADLRDIQGRIRDQKSLCEQEIGIGARWGSKLPPGVQAPNLDAAPRTDKNALQQVQDLLVDDADEIHLKAGDESWMEDDAEEEIEEEIEVADLLEAEAGVVVKNLTDKPIVVTGTDTVIEPEQVITPDDEPKESSEDVSNDEADIDAILAEVEAAKNDTTPVEGDDEADEAEDLSDIELAPEVEAEVEAKVAQAEKDIIAIKAEADVAPVEATINVDDLFDAEPEGDEAAKAMPSVTTDEDVDDLFRRLTVDPASKPKSKSKTLPPPDEGDDLDSLIDMFA